MAMKLIPVNAGLPREGRAGENFTTAGLSEEFRIGDRLTTSDSENRDMLRRAARFS
jgi:hypothetical protein